MIAEHSPGPAIIWDAHSIHALRMHVQRSQRALAADLGVRQQTVSEWETGLYRPRGASITLLNLLARDSAFDPQDRSEVNGARPEAPARAAVDSSRYPSGAIARARASGVRHQPAAKPNVMASAPQAGRSVPATPGPPESFVPQQAANRRSGVHVRDVAWWGGEVPV